MKSSITYEFTTDGKQNIFPIVWPFIHRGYVKVTMNDTPVEQGFSWVNEHYIRFSTAPPKGTKLSITRRTPRSDSLVTPYDGSTITAEDLRTNQRQALHVMEETTDYMQGLLKDILDGNGELKKLQSLRVVVEEAEAGEPILANYNPDTNTLSLKLPRGEKGEQGKPAPTYTTGVIDGGYPDSIALTTLDGGYA